MRRRSLLRRSVLVAAVGAAGCIGGPGDGPSTEPEPTGSTETDAPTPTRTPTATASPAPTATPTALPPVDREVVVGADAELRFAPSSFEIATGDTVRWRFETGGHNVRPSSVPDGADWSGTPGGDSTTYPRDHTYAYTFEVAGTYEYYCAPHRSAGMTGSFTVD